MRERLGSILWGIIFVAIGVGFAGNALEIWNFRLFFDGWWTLLIIVPCLISAIQDGPDTGNMLGMIIGAVLLLACRNVIDAKVLARLIVPILFIGLGLRLILGKRRVPRNTYGNMSSAAAKRLYYGVFCTKRERIDGKNLFEGCRANSFCGTLELDLTEASIAGDCVIHINAVCANVKIMLPYNVKAESDCVRFFGGDKKSFKDCEYEEAPTVFIIGPIVFGHVKTV